MTQDDRTPDMPEWLKLIISASLNQGPQNQRPASPSGLVLGLVNELAAMIKASEVKVPDSLKGVFDDPRATPPPSPEPRGTTLHQQKRDTQHTKDGGLPTLRAGIYKHWRGRPYQVTSYALDADIETFTGRGVQRNVVVYSALYFDPNQTGPRTYVRTVEHFFGQVCRTTGLSLEACTTKLAHEHDADHEHDLVDRFTYVGPEWTGAL